MTTFASRANSATPTRIASTLFRSIVFSGSCISRGVDLRWCSGLPAMTPAVETADAAERRRLLALAADDARALLSERMTFPTAIGDLLLAGVEAVRGRPERAGALLDQSIAGAG